MIFCWDVDCFIGTQRRQKKYFVPTPEEANCSLAVDKKN
jgi:hypothetical protein